MVAPGATDPPLSRGEPRQVQPVHTLRRLGVPLTVARTRWMLGLNRRFVILRDHGRLLPKPGFLAQMSQTAATGYSWSARVQKVGVSPASGQPRKSIRRPPRRANRRAAPTRSAVATTLQPHGSTP